MFDLLSVLVGNHGRVLDKEFLLHAVWPDSFVEEGNISFNIRQLRKLLGDSVQSPLYIETIPRRGYRFVASVTETIEADPDSEVETSKPEDRPDTRSSVRSIPLMTAATLVLVLFAAAIGIAAWFVRSRDPGTAPILSAPFALEKLSSDGQVFQAAVSPDGHSVVYSRRNGSKQSLWLRQLESSDNTQILPPSEFSYYGLEFSTDGKSVYFTRGTNPYQAKQMDIFRISVFGGVPQKVVSGTQGWISLSADGRKISFVRCPYETDEYCSLWIADASDGANERRLVTRAAPDRIGDNKISPDGRKVAFASGQSRNASNEFVLSEVDIESGTVHDLSPERFFNIGNISWLPAGGGLLLTARKQADRNFRIWQFSPSTGEVSQLTNDSQSYAGLSLSKDGSVLVSRQYEPNFHLKVYQTENPKAAPAQLGNGSYVAFAPDGKLVFSSLKTGNPEIWSTAVDGSGERLLTSDAFENVTPIVTPDGASIFYSSNRTGQVQVWRMNRDGSNQTQITRNEGGTPLYFLPDGHWLYYRAALQRTLRRVSLESGADELVYINSSGNFALSPDCTRVATVERENGENVISIVALADGKTLNTLRFARPNEFLSFSIWTPDGKNLAHVMTDESDTKKSVYLQPINGEKARKIADLSDENSFDISGLAFALDGKSFAVAQGSWNHNAVLIKGLKQSN